MWCFTGLFFFGIFPKRSNRLIYIPYTSTNEKGTKALALGADHIINYTSSDIYTEVNRITCGQGVDVVVDHVGAKFFESAFNSLKPGGRYGICGVTTGYKTQLHMEVFLFLIHLLQ